MTSKPQYFSGKNYGKIPSIRNVRELSQVRNIFLLAPSLTSNYWLIIELVEWIKKDDTHAITNIHWAPQRIQILYFSRIHSELVTAVSGQGAASRTSGCVIIQSKQKYQNLLFIFFYITQVILSKRYCLNIESFFVRTQLNVLQLSGIISVDWYVAAYCVLATIIIISMNWTFVWK